MPIKEIIKRCVESDENLNDLRWSRPMYDNELSHYFKIVRKKDDFVPADVFASSVKDQLYIDGVYDLGFTLKGSYEDECVLLTAQKAFPTNLVVGKAYSSNIPDFDNYLEIENCRSLDSYYSDIQSTLLHSDDTKSFNVIQSPYGQNIPIKGYELEPEFDPQIESITTLDKHILNSYNKKKNRRPQLNTIRSSLPLPSYSEPQRRKNGSRKGEVWWVDHLECDNDQISSPYLKNRPIIVIQVIRGIVSYYHCTTNNIMYFYRKIKLADPLGGGLSKEPVFVELHEMTLDESRLRTFKGILTDEDMNKVFNPPDEPYWKNQFKAVVD